MKIAVVGMGLIGGSLCRAFHHYTPHKVLGTTRNHKTVEFALSVGAIDEELTDLREPDVTSRVAARWPRAALILPDEPPPDPH